MSRKEIERELDKIDRVIDEGHILAVLVLQTELYNTSPSIKQYVDSVLALVEDLASTES